MLDRTRTRIGRTYEIDVLSTDTVNEAGLCLTGVMESNLQKARRSNAVDNTIFLGASWGDYLGVSTALPKSVTGNFGAANSGGAGFASFTLPAVSTGTADMAVLLGTGYGGTRLAISGDATPTAGEFYLAPDGRTVTTENANAGAPVFAVYRYAPSAGELLMNYGDAFMPQGATALKRIGVIATGDIFATNFDTSIDWSTIDTFATTEALRGGANGRFTVNSAGAVCRNAFVISAPKAGDMYLGIRLEN